MQMTLKSARVNAGLSAEKASECIGVSTVTLSNWETGKSYPNLKILPAILNAYGCSYEDINFFPNKFDENEFATETN